MEISAVRWNWINCASCRVLVLLLCCGCAHSPYVPAFAGTPRESAAPAPESVPLEPLVLAQASSLQAGVAVAVQYGISKKNIALTLTQPATLTSGGRTVELGPGAWSLTSETTALPRTRFNVYSKAFLNDEEALLRTYLDDLRRQGFSPGTHIFGKRFEAAGGRVVDNRQFWAAIGIFEKEADVAPFKARLNQQSIWAWHREEKLDEGRATLAFRQSGAAPVATVELPVTLTSAGAASLQFDGGKALTVNGNISFALAMKGGVEATAQLPLEDYLAGVLPAEMPASWPREALKAQAVAARSEVLANLAGKHRLEGFDFCILEHCRVYGGRTLQAPASDEAVESTRGEVITNRNRAVPTVFSANCGGWTENNDTVWSGPPQDTLRGRFDGAGQNSPPLSGDAQVRKWVGASGVAWCNDGSKNYRWTRDYSAAELSAAVNKAHAVGRVQQLIPGDRGVSGRLKSIKIVGDKSTATVQKELPIRQALGGLPSALFVVSPWKDGGGALHFRFQGAGRGHGVGLCQAGARGLALKGGTYSAILNHYFTGVELQRLY